MNDTVENTTNIFETLFIKKSFAAYVILTVAVLLGLVGNSLFLITLFRLKTGLSNMYIIMSSLSITDIVGGLAFSETLIRDFFIKSYVVQYETCKWGLFFSVCALSSNAWHVLLIATDRYTAITHAHR